ncbi:MAG TPA: response regulator [Chloroflexota bacterium]|jgi:diguanylate cyclase (GGDEF)-like protein|nr:response regulator [Chloroflexota bacterium]
MQSSVILCVDDDEQIRDLVTIALSLAGYQVVCAADGAEALRRAVADQPQLILLDVMLPDMRGYEVLHVLKRDPRTVTIPIIFLSALDGTNDRVLGLEEGADDYIGKPFAIKELVARVATQLRHAEEHLLSELTGLPGNVQIERALGRALKDPRRDLYVLYVDIDNFKSFNDAYGFLRGNELIKLAATLLRDALANSEDAFLGHIGGDDFVLIGRNSEEAIVDMCEQIITRFDSQAPALYDPDDREQGYVEATDRQNVRHRFPLVTLSIAVVTNRRRHIADVWEASAIAAELKKHAKLSGRSSYHIDQRTG